MVETGRSAFNEIVTEPLTKKNHVAWFASVKSYLIARDLWEIIDGTFEKPLEEDEEHKLDFMRWRRLNAAALHAIQISCAPVSFNYIMHYSEAKVAWNALNYNYNPPIKLEYSPQVMAEEVDYDVEDLYKAICENNWSDAKAFIDQHYPSALSAGLTPRADTALHVAALDRNVSMVEELVALVPPQFLEIVNTERGTPLAYAAGVGDTRIVECMVNKNNNILSISTIGMMALPVTVAILNGHKELGRYLYSRTPLECLKPDKGIEGPLLLSRCFITGNIDIALDLLQRCPELLFATLEEEVNWTPVKGIAGMPSAFLSGSKPVFWKRWIYDYINIPPTTTTNFARVDIEQQGQGEGVQGLGLVQRIISHLYNLLGMKEIYEAKWLHTQAAQILRLICKNATAIERNIDKKNVFAGALFHAAKEGNAEFVAKVSKAAPSTLLFSESRTNRHMFFYAVKYRQAEIFNLIHETPFKTTLASKIDITWDTILHMAGKLAPSSQLNRISGATMQMQSELQWFKEVESVVPSGFRAQLNKDGMKAEEIFKETHTELRKEGEKWMKETASSCSVVGTLIVTIMFAAAFTIPGGNNQDNQDSGYPIFLKDKLFMVFILSDALSLFSSTTSVLMFLGIFTSRYAEEDFLESLPRKLIIGLFTLFFSIATMMVAFSACILIMLQHAYSWAFLPIIMLASVPVTIFALLQFPLLLRMIYSTYGPSKFKKKVKSDS